MNQSHANIPITRERFDAVLFDLDGVITNTAKVHAAAWKTLFDEYLEQLSAKVRIPFEPFDAVEDYKTYVDGKPRYKGVQSFLDSRGVHLYWGSEDDPPFKETVCGLGNRKNEVFHRLLERDGVEVFEPADRLIGDLRSHGVQTAVVSSSKNCEAVLKVAGLLGEFDARVDGKTASRLGLAGKPEPASFLEAAARLDVKPERAIVVEDATAGVEAGKNGSFGFVLGIGGDEDREALERHGADLMLKDLQGVEIR